MAYAVKMIDWTEPAHPKISSEYVSMAPVPEDMPSNIPDIWSSTASGATKLLKKTLRCCVPG